MHVKFVYREGVRVPSDVVRVRVHPSVTEIPYAAFAGRKKLEEVELCEGLLEIGTMAFNDCVALKRITISSTIVRIARHAFCQASVLSLRLNDDVDCIEKYAFCCCNMTTFKTPPLIETITEGMLSKCIRMFSVEIYEGVIKVEGPEVQIDGYNGAFRCCHSLRNVALPPDAEIGHDAFLGCTDLHQLFFVNTQDQVINALKHRFDNLPIHKMIYYQSYQPITVDQLSDEVHMKSSQRRKLRRMLGCPQVDPTGKQQDCLGMTPLHILACSTVQNIELYRVLIEKYPDNLITKDRWEALPILYAIWGDAPNEIVQFLVSKYKSLYPNNELNWTHMMKTLGRANVKPETLQSLLELQQESFPNQSIDWDSVLEPLTTAGSYYERGASNKTFRFLLGCSIKKRVNAIGLKLWRDGIYESLRNQKASYTDQRRAHIDRIRTKLANVETKFRHLKEATSIVELAMWKHKINGCSQEKTRSNKKLKIADSDARNRCRISCGADIVVEHMLPYLVCDTAEVSSDDGSESDSDSDDEGEWL